jgi:hypothetical protein
MLELKDYQESKKYEYEVCEIRGCVGTAERIFLSNTNYLELCVYHYDEMLMI